MSGGFGSDGYRGIIGHSFTRQHLLPILCGIAKYLKHDLSLDPLSFNIPIGYDTRFLSRESAHYCARVLDELGFDPVVSDFACPSPYLSFATRKLDAPVGLQITASHNPSTYGGVKLKGNHGGSLFPSEIELIKTQTSKADIQSVEGLSLIGEAFKQGFDLRREYGEELIEAAGEQIEKEQYLVADFMHGCSAQVYKTLLEERYQLNSLLRSEPDPLFGGIKPEPLPHNLAELAARVQYDGHESLGVAFDGDGDRLAVVDETGQFLAPHEIFCLLLERTVQLRGTGPVVGTVSFSSIVERAAIANGCEYFESPVGFKSVSEAMLTHQAILGGEESGGTGFGHYLPERDALLMAISLIDARISSGVSLHELVRNLYQKYGQSFFAHSDYKLTAELDSVEIRKRMSALAKLDSLAGNPISNVSTLDGVKLRTQQGWTLVRTSGTEPLVRIYADAQSLETANDYIKATAAELGLSN